MVSSVKHFAGSSLTILPIIRSQLEVLRVRRVRKMLVTSVILIGEKSDA